MILLKRAQQSIFQALENMNRVGTGNGAAPNGLIGGISLGGQIAGGGQGGYSTANLSTWTDITNTSTQLTVSRTSWALYLLFCVGHISAGAGTGNIRGNIVGFDVTASAWCNSTSVENMPMVYIPFIKYPLGPGIYTMKLQASTDNGTTLTVDQVFHMVFLLG